MKRAARKSHWNPVSVFVPITAISLLALSACGVSPAAEESQVAAKVNQQSITVREVDREVKRALRGQEATGDALALLQAQALKQLVDRQLILTSLERTQRGASAQDVQLEIDRLTKQLKQTGRTLAEHLTSIGLDEPGLRRHYAWQLGWGRYLTQYLTDENQAKHFERHRREFDGTELRVAHILLNVQPANDPAALTAALAKAKQIRAEIVAGKTTFAEAAKQYSSAPTAEAGGDIGKIARRDPMPESFSRVAFALEVNAVSEPVVTHYGVHLIQCLEVFPGKLTWQDVRPDLQAAMAEYLFNWTADRERASAKIEFTGTYPYFKPGTSALVKP